MAVLKLVLVKSRKMFSMAEIPTNSFLSHNGYGSCLTNNQGDSQFQQQQCGVSNPTLLTHPQVMPLTVRISHLNLRLMKLLQTKAKNQVHELQNFYYLKSAELESDRFGSLNSTNGNHWMQTSTNDYFDQQHHYFIKRIEQSLTLIEEQLNASKKHTKESTTVVTLPTPPLAKTSPINPVALRILTNWYERNSEHPYPSYETAEVMAKAGNITVEQVKKWFANRRLRLGDTKHITDIAKRRKRARTVSTDDLFLEGSIPSE